MEALALRGYRRGNGDLYHIDGDIENGFVAWSASWFFADDASVRLVEAVWL